jgi:alkaline phosphatase
MNSSCETSALTCTRSIKNVSRGFCNAIVDVELRYLKTINNRFAALAEQRHYVLGNHCVDTLTKEEFLGAVGKKKSWYSFSQGPAHFIVLDSCFCSDGQPYGRKNSEWTDANIPAEQLEWLRADLAESHKPVIIFAHQRLDVSTAHGVRNCVAVREILEASRKVLAVFQGHSHQNDLTEINGIHYCTLVAMVEGPGAVNNGYSVMEVTSDRSIRITGFRNQKAYALPRA